MKRFLIAIALLGLLTSCDDGDIIVTDFDFEDSTLQFCEGPDKFVIFATNNDDVNESISLEFTNSNITTDDSGKFITNTSENITFSLSGTNKVIYRIYNKEIDGSKYFCQGVPPSEPVPTTEYVSGSDGTVTIATRFTDETGDADPDDDGLSNLQEGWDPDGINHQDTDGDGIPDYLDRDDDGDNVITRVEIVNENNYPQREGAIPYYLNPDDDGDGVETRLEVSEEDGLTNPGSFTSTGDGVPNYLNDQQTAFIQHNEYITHNITRNYGYRVTLRNFSLTRTDDGSGETISYSSYQLGSLNETNIPFELCPNTVENCDDEEEETDETEETDEETSN